MGKKGSCLSAITSCCISDSKQKKPVNEAEKRNSRLKNGGGNRSFIPFNREPSSIEKILGEIEQQNLFIAGHHTTIPQQSEPQPSVSEKPQSPPRVESSSSPPRVVSPPRIVQPPRVVSPPRIVDTQTEIKVNHTQEPSLEQRDLSATKIQAVYRGYMARRKLRGLNGLVRLQGVVRGQHVTRQTVNAMKQMQLLTRLQTQIQSRRMQTIENQALKRQAESSVGKNQLEMGDEDWDDSVITKEEREARLQRKLDALNKREKAMAYANSHQLWKATPKSSQNTLMGYPWWWNWLDRQPPSNTSKTQSVKNQKSSPRPTTPSPQKKAVNNLDSPIRPSSSRSTAPSRSRLQMTPSRTSPLRMMKLSNPRRAISGGSASGSVSGSPYPGKDDDSLMSCPPFSVPRYMSPTASAKAKARPMSNPRDRTPGTPGSVSSQRRFSFPATPSSRGSGGKHKSPGSVGDFSVDSAFSIGRKPFNRFV